MIVGIVLGIISGLCRGDIRDHMGIIEPRLREQAPANVSTQRGRDSPQQALLGAQGGPNFRWGIGIGGAVRLTHP